MHILKRSLLLVIFWGLTSCFSLGQVIDIGEATRSGKGRLSISVESPDASVSGLIRRAFELHGGYELVAPSKSSYNFKIERTNDDSSVTLIIHSGRPAQELLRRVVRGNNLEDAVLRAGDLAVEATLQTKGFFAGKLAFVGKQRGISEIYTSDLLFRRVRPLTADRALVTGPDWAPDGVRLLYTTYHKSGFPDIYMLDLKNGRKRAIANFKGTNSSAEFSPDGRQIAMSLSGSGNNEIFVSDSNGRKLRRITANKSLETAPTWSPDGSRLVFVSDAQGKPQLYELPVSGGSMKRLPTNISNYCSEPACNPVNNDLIAFTAAVRGGFQIAVYNRRSRSSEILTNMSQSAVEPVWLNDGRHLVFTRRSKGSTGLMLLDSKTKKVSSLHVPDFGDTSSATFVY